jgi:hypothetical protein
MTVTRLGLPMSRPGVRPWAVLSAVIPLLATSSQAKDPNSRTARFEFRDLNDQSLAIVDDAATVLVYNHGDIRFSHAGRVRSRSSYVHPIFGLDGEVLTDDFPADHHHHHGLFWCWPHVTVGNRDYDFWERDDIDIVFKRWLAKDANADAAELAVENGWFIDGAEIVQETLRLKVHPVTAAGRSIDVSLSWRPNHESMTLSGAAGKSYGGVSLRFAPRKETVVTIPGGPTGGDLLVTNLPWADLTGRFAGASGPSGAALFVHPSNPDFPPEWMTREYGLLAVGWPGIEPRTIEPGETATCRYRVWVHRGRVDADTLNLQFEQFANEVSGKSPTE